MRDVVHGGLHLGHLLQHVLGLEDFGVPLLQQPGPDSRVGSGAETVCQPTKCTGLRCHMAFRTHIFAALRQPMAAAGTLRGLDAKEGLETWQRPSFQEPAAPQDKTNDCVQEHLPLPEINAFFLDAGEIDATYPAVSGSAEEGITLETREDQSMVGDGRDPEGRDGGGTQAGGGAMQSLVWEAYIRERRGRVARSVSSPDLAVSKCIYERPRPLALESC